MFIAPPFFNKKVKVINMKFYSGSEGTNYEESKRSGCGRVEREREECKEREECEEKERKHHKHHDHRRHYPLQRLVALNAATGSAGPFTVSAGTLFTLPAPVNVVSVLVDADDFLEDLSFDDGWFFPGLRTLLTFTALINLNTLTLGTTLNFQLVRSTREGAVTLGPVFTFSMAIAAGLAQIAPFTFQFLDSGIAPDDYTYTVQLAPGSSVTGALVLGASVSVTNAMLNAMAAV